nr:hypothetical protein [Tanacetum cinerariifolium]
RQPQPFLYPGEGAGAAVPGISHAGAARIGAAAAYQQRRCGAAVAGAQSLARRPEHAASVAGTGPAGGHERNQAQAALQANLRQFGVHLLPAGPHEGSRFPAQARPALGG